MNSTQNEKLDMMYNLARSAKASNDTTTAKKYYDMILAEDPLNWEPVFYSVYYSYATMKNGEIAKLLNISESAVKVRYLRAKKLLLQKRGKELDEMRKT